MLEIEFGFLPQTFFLVLARLVGLTGTVPFYGGAKVPVPIRGAFALIIALMITPLVSPAWVAKAAEMTTLFGLVAIIFSEILFGASIGLICQLFSSVFLVGGLVISQGAGLMMAQELDPLTAERNHLISQLVQTTFILLVVVAGGHLVLLKLVTESFYAIPPRLTWITHGWIPGMIALSADMYEWGVRFAAPVMGTVFLVNIGFGLVAKAAPGFNVLFLSMPVRLGVALVVTGNIMRFGHTIYESVITRMLTACASFFG